MPFVVIPVAVGTAVTLLLVNVFPARRARDILMLMGLLFAGSVVVLLRVIQPERLLRVESLPDVTDFFATLQSPITPLLPSFWAAEALFACSRGASTGSTWPRCGRRRWPRPRRSRRRTSGGISWDSARSQEARKTRFTRLEIIERLTRALPMSPRRAVSCSSRTSRSSCAT